MIRWLVIIALNKSRTGSNIINTQHMLKEEILLFERLVSELSIFRTGILENLLALQKPSLIEHELRQPIVQAAPVEPDVKKEELPLDQPDPLKKVKLLEDVPKFIGPELEPYGPYQQEQVTDLPPEIAKLLVNKHGAEAPIHAAMKADALLDKGDMDGEAVWLRIMKAVKELLNARPGDGVPIH